jgi:hypothetical protein
LDLLQLNVKPPGKAHVDEIIAILWIPKLPQSFPVILFYLLDHTIGILVSTSTKIHMERCPDIMLFLIICLTTPPCAYLISTMQISYTFLLRLFIKNRNR